MRVIEKKNKNTIFKFLMIALRKHNPKFCVDRTSHRFCYIFFVIYCVNIKRVHSQKNLKF